MYILLLNNNNKKIGRTESAERRLARE